jgi:hypothetical protein
MCGIKSLSEDQITLVRPQQSIDMTMGEPLQHRTMLATPGGIHVNDVTLNGADSSILRCTIEQVQSSLSTSSSSNDDPSSNKVSSAAPLLRGTLESLVNRGVKVTPNQKCSPSVRRPGTREKNRIRTFSKRMGDGHGQFRNWRVSGAFGPREMEKLTMINIDRDPALDVDEIMHVNVAARATTADEHVESFVAVRRPRRRLRREPGASRKALPMRSSSSAGELDSLDSTPLPPVWVACALNARYRAQ